MFRMQKLSSCPFDTLKHCSNNFTKVVFKTSRWRLWVLRVIRLLNTIRRLRTKRFFECPEYRNCQHVSSRCHVTSLHRHHQSCFLRRSQGRLLVLRVIRLLETSLKKHRRNRFFQCLEFTKSVRMVFLNNETSIHRSHQSRILRISQNIWVLKVTNVLKTTLDIFIKVSFLILRMKNRISYSLSTPWDIVSCTSSKSFLKTSRR
jgi:hypothetical protein